MFGVFSGESVGDWSRIIRLSPLHIGHLAAALMLQPHIWTHASGGKVNWYMFAFMLSRTIIPSSAIAIMTVIKFCVVLTQVHHCLTPFVDMWSDLYV